MKSPGFSEDSMYCRCNRVDSASVNLSALGFHILNDDELTEILRDGSSKKKMWKFLNMEIEAETEPSARGAGLETTFQLEG